MASNTRNSIFVEAFHEWRNHRVPRMAAAVSFYAIFSLAPLLILVISIASLVLGHKLAEGTLAFQMRDFFGPGGARFLMTTMHHGHGHHSATFFGVVALLWGSTAAFVEIQNSLNAIWGVGEKPGGFLKGMVRARCFSFALVAAMGILLIASLIASALISAVGHGVSGFLPQASRFFGFANFVVSFAVVTFLFAAIYKILPDVKIEWRDVWTGALFTALLFTLGKHFLGLYLGKAAITSAYGAAGSLVLLLLWVFYSSQILFFGAAFTKIRFARRNRIVPKPHASIKQ